MRKNGTISPALAALGMPGLDTDTLAAFLSSEGNGTATEEMRALRDVIAWWEKQGEERMKQAPVKGPREIAAVMRPLMRGLDHEHVLRVAHERHDAHLFLDDGVRIFRIFLSLVIVALAP